MSKSKVYFSKEISKENLVNIYKILNVQLPGKIAVKVHSGEDGNQNYLRPEFMKKHKWTEYYNVDIMDEEEDFELPIPDGKVIKSNYVGSHLKNYDSMLVISHFKGHPMGGYGGALKNMSIGIASSYGKAYIHGAGEPEKIWTAEHNLFLESMADADKSIMDYFKENIVFINIMCNMSVDCDCCAVAELGVGTKDYELINID